MTVELAKEIKCDKCGSTEDITVRTGGTSKHEPEIICLNCLLVAKKKYMEEGLDRFYKGH